MQLRILKIAFVENDSSEFSYKQEEKLQRFCPDNYEWVDVETEWMLKDETKGEDDPGYYISEQQYNKLTARKLFW